MIASWSARHGTEWKDLTSLEKTYQRGIRLAMFSTYHVWILIAKRYPSLGDFGGRSIFEPSSPARRLEGPIGPRIWTPRRVTRQLRGVEWRWRERIELRCLGRSLLLGGEF